jgi:dihydroorotate dehydrogenase
MPDWTYQTVFRPILFRLGPARARSLALGTMGRLARLPLGRRVIQLMGHMTPDPRLRVERDGLTFPTPVGLGCSIDPHLTATPAFAEFGFGFLEIGPVAPEPPARSGKIHLDTVGETLSFEPPQASLTPIAARERLQRDGPFRMPVLARVAPKSPEEACGIIEVLGSRVDGFIVPIDQLAPLRLALNDSSSPRPLLLASVTSDGWQNATSQEKCTEAALEGVIQGFVVAGPNLDDGQQSGRPHLDAAIRTARAVRSTIGPQPIIVGSAGVHSPADALDYFDAGADLVQVDSGLVFTGPGLPKRINEAVLYRQLATAREEPESDSRLGGQSWFWALLMGLAMFVGGVIALAVAATRVVLPYDESMSGLTREELAQINDRLLAFMTHDRVTLAGTMLAVAIQYVALAWWGIRRGVHWAYVSVNTSALAGFLCFFSFLGFGYFDPFHAFVTAVLFQFLLLAVHSHLPRRHCMEMPCLQNDRRWALSQWGQLLFVAHGAVLIVAGLVITRISMTSVFVHEDLAFMQTSAADLFGAHPQLVPLVAHDRATFGGMLIACGLATLLPALWGFRRGQAWLWWALILAGNTAYGLTILVHWHVGYDSLMHLVPAYAGLMLLWVGGLLSHSFLAVRDEGLALEWKRRLERRPRGDSTLG